MRGSALAVQLILIAYPTNARAVRSRMSKTHGAMARQALVMHAHLGEHSRRRELVVSWGPYSMLESEVHNVSEGTVV